MVALLIPAVCFPTRPFDTLVLLGALGAVILCAETLVLARSRRAFVRQTIPGGRRVLPLPVTLGAATLAALALTAWLWVQDVAAAAILPRALGCGIMLTPDDYQARLQIGLAHLNAA